MVVDTHRRRRVWLLAVIGACMAVLASTWAYATSLEEWGATRELVFQVVTIGCLAVGLLALVLLAADLVAARRR